MIKVNEEGVPRIIQRIQYLSLSYCFKVLFFNGEIRYVSPRHLLKYPPDIMARNISSEQLIDAYNKAEKLGMKLL